MRKRNNPITDLYIAPATAGPKRPRDGGLLRQAGLLRSGGRLVALTLGVIAGLGASPALASWIDGDVATLQALDKITARISTLQAPIGVTVTFGTLDITVQRCAFHPPEEPPEDAGFIEIVDRGHDPSQPGMPVFSGWMFSSSPAISALEHPVYDVTLLGCNQP
jgi:hypothetical protein